MKILSKKLVDKIRNVLIHSVGDIRTCPFCGKDFIPRDQTADDAWELYKKLFDKKKK